MWDFQSQSLRELLDSFRKSHPVVLHQEPQYRSVCSAAEAVIELLFRTHPEGRGFLTVERAAGHVLPARLLQRYPQADNLDDVRARDQFVDEALRDESHSR